MTIQDEANRAKLDNLMTKATTNDAMSHEEVGFAVLLVERFRADLDAKLDKIKVIEGEINQLRTNERIITEIVKNLVAAADRETERLRAEKELRQTG